VNAANLDGELGDDLGRFPLDLVGAVLHVRDRGWLREGRFGCDGDLSAARSACITHHIARKKRSAEHAVSWLADGLEGGLHKRGVAISRPGSHSEVEG